MACTNKAISALWGGEVESGSSDGRQDEKFTGVGIAGMSITYMMQHDSLLELARYWKELPNMRVAFSSTK